MKKILAEGYEFDDVLIVPIVSGVSSRDDVVINVKLNQRTYLEFPLIASPMVGVVDGQFAKKLSDLGGLAIFHRFYKNNQLRVDDISNNVGIDDNYGIALKIGDAFLDTAIQLEPNIILIDTANGYTKRLMEYCLYVTGRILEEKKDILLMAGNVASASGSSALFNVGVDIIRVGIGGGSPCSTRNQTGIAIPNISALLECSEVENHGKPILAIDGGIKNPGDFVKSVVAGARLGVSGRLFAECYEAPNEGVLYGMASRTHMENTKTTIKSVEGFDTYIEKKHSLEQFVREFGYGIRSAGTYLNAKNLDQIEKNGEFIKVSDRAIKKNL